jgi:hypothetical protein
MVELKNLAVSLTKNGYLKIATLVERHPSEEILDNVYGVHAGINLQRSQVANILCADPNVPSLWDDIRRFDRRTIQAFTFLAVVFSHHRLIQLFLDAGQGSPRGTISRGDISDKEFTNLVYAMAELDLCEYEKGASSIDYDLTSLVDQLRRPRRLVERLFRAKLVRCGWRDPDQYPQSGDQPVLGECQRQRFHDALGLRLSAFSEWLTGRRPSPR